MERVEQNMLINGNDEEVNGKIQDPIFRERFKKEWEEITAMLRQIREESLNNKNKEQKEVFRPTSSSVVFK